MRMQRFVLTAGGLGMLRYAPGTWGSLPPVVLAFAMASLAVEPWMMTVTLALLGLAGSIACVRFGQFGEQLFHRKDAPEIVADEVAGQCIALLFLPWRVPVDGQDWLVNLGLAVGAFAAFRLFDITKPPPANGLQRLPAGWGVLADDLVAGAYALLVMQVAVAII